MHPAGLTTALIREVEEAFEASNVEFARAYYLFATAKLSDTYNSQAIYAKYPILNDEKTFQALKDLYDTHPSDESIKRLFTSVLGTYLGNQLAEKTDALQNKKNQLTVAVGDMGLVDASGSRVEELLYEDVSEWLKKIDTKPDRQELYDRMSAGYLSDITPLFLELFDAETGLFHRLGYTDLIEFYSNTSGHNLQALGEAGRRLIDETDDWYLPRMARLYEERTGVSFSEATRADISFVFHGESPEMAEINKRFSRDNLYPLAAKTFDGLGLAYSQTAQCVDYPSMDAYEKDVVHHTPPGNGQFSGRILLDMAKREGKRARAFVYPALVPSEIYLSVKPEGGLDDYSAFFHESGHALHFAYENPKLSFAMALMGNNTVTESYAYLMQNLFLNRHWLQHMAGLSAAEAEQVVNRGALNDLYMLRRYGSKMQFELRLFDGTGITGKDAIYADLLTRGTGFLYDKEGWSRDVDAGFYVADYFTAWSLEAQLREYLCSHFGLSDPHGEDWYQNPQAGAFLKALWHDGNLTQQELSHRLGVGDPTSVSALLKFMHRNLG